MVQMVRGDVPCVVAYPVKQCLLACDCDSPVEFAGTHAAGQEGVGGHILHVQEVITYKSIIIIN